MAGEVRVRRGKTHEGRFDCNLCADDTKGQDVERGTARMIEQAIPVIRKHYEAAIRKCPEGVIRITLDFEGKGPYG